MNIHVFQYQASLVSRPFITNGLGTRLVSGKIKAVTSVMVIKVMVAKAMITMVVVTKANGDGDRSSI